MKPFTLLFVALLFGCNSIAQERIDGNFEFQTDPAKKYSIYIPSGYSASTPHRLMLALHPFNTDRWDAVSWCDTLIVFAETNNLILACPDGGIDGQIDDSIDTAFTTALLDSMEFWYNIDLNKIYAMGFSWGGRTTYSYGLNHHERLKGFMPIGAAVNGTDQVSGIIQYSENKPFYLVHGTNDNPAIRYTPMLNALNDNNAIINSILLPGVGHTIDFENRNQILADAYIWIDSINCIETINDISFIDFENFKIEVTPNPIASSQQFNIKVNIAQAENIIFNLIDTKGLIVYTSKNHALLKGENNILIPTQQLKSGIYFLQGIIRNKIQQTTRIVIPKE